MHTFQNVRAFGIAYLENLFCQICDPTYIPILNALVVGRSLFAIEFLFSNNVFATFSLFTCGTSQYERIG